MFRFCFLGDDDLLEILGQPSNPEVIQAHLKKVYAGINSVTFAGGAITHMTSAAGENVELCESVQATLVVEEWLNALTDGMRVALRAQLQAALHSDGSDRWTTQPAQVMSLAQELAFCQVRQGIRCGPGAYLSSTPRQRRHAPARQTDGISVAGPDETLWF